MDVSSLLSAIEYDLTTRQLAVLLLIRNGNKTPTRMIALMLKIPRPSVTRAFDGLCSRGLIKRMRGPEDMRDVYGVLTTKGDNLVEAMK